MGSTEDSKEMEDIRQTEEWAEYLRSFNWKVEKVGKVLVFIKKIPLTPLSMMKIQRFSGELDLDGLKKLKKKHKVVYTVAEPALGYDPLSAQWPKRPAPPISGVAPARVGPLEMVWVVLRATCALALLEPRFDSIMATVSERQFLQEVGFS